MNTTNDPPAWVKALEPSPNVAITNIAVEDGVRVEARWWITDGEKVLMEGPREVLITLLDEASPAARSRGITSGVLRRIEGLLRKLTDEVSGQATAPVQDEFWADVLEWVREMPDSPRSRTGDYYRMLINLFEFLDQQYANPVVKLEQAMTEAGRNVSRATINKQLQRARAMRREGTV